MRVFAEAETKSTRVRRNGITIAVMQPGTQKTLKTIIGILPFNSKQKTKNPSVFRRAYKHFISLL
jgi:hypothetical protein